MDAADAPDAPEVAIGCLVQRIPQIRIVVTYDAHGDRYPRPAAGQHKSHAASTTAQSPTIR